MKLGKEQIQKIFLGLLLLIGLLYVYFALLLAPVSKNIASANASAASLEPQINDAKKQISKTAALEKEAPAAIQTLDQLKSAIPEGAPVAWFPPRMAEFFKRQGIDKTVTRLTNELPEKDLPGFRRLVWAIDVPKVEFTPLGIALAGLENEEPLLQVTNVAIDTSKEDVQYQHATLTVATIVKQ